MRCPKCDSDETKVIFTFPTKAGIILVSRKRHCSDCGTKYETVERLVENIRKPRPEDSSSA